MTREEAAAVLDAMIFGTYPNDDITIEKIEMEAVRFAIAALRGPEAAYRYQNGMPQKGGIKTNPCDNCIGPMLAIIHGYKNMKIRDTEVEE